MTFRKAETLPSVMRLASKRVRDLMTLNLLKTETIETLLISAYLQGIIDAVETMKEKKEETK